MDIKKEPQLGTTGALRASRFCYFWGYPLLGAANEVNCAMNNKVPNLEIYSFE
jgi:hypothetical protein